MVVDVIPPQLQDDKFRFCLVRKGAKIPLEKSWSSSANYKFNDEKLTQHIASGGNVGVLSGVGNLLVVDCDTPDVCKKVRTELPETFSVTSGEGSHHYFICDDVDEMEQTQISGERPSHIFVGKHQVMIPPSLHPNGKRYSIKKNVPIVSISSEDIYKCFRYEAMKVDLIYDNKRRVSNNVSILMKTVLQKYDVKGLLSHDADEYFAPHPIHGSSGGKNFWVNTRRNTWYCFRCRSGGGSLHLIALLEEKIKCSDMSSTPLRGQIFKDVYNLALSKGLISQVEQEKFSKNRATYLMQKAGKEAPAMDDTRPYVELLHKHTPFFYDKTLSFWVWDNEYFMYERADETDMMNVIDLMLVEQGQRKTSVRANVKYGYLEAMKRIGRLRVPEQCSNWGVQFRDSVTDLKTGKVSQSSPKQHSLNSIPWRIGETENTPTLDKLFTDWVGKTHVRSLFEVIAFATTRQYFPQRIICLDGSGSNGKSTFLNIIQKFVGKSNYCTSSIELLSSANGRFETSNLYGKLACLMGESDYGTQKKTDLLKMLSGGDPIRGEFKRQNPFPFINYAKLIIATNCLAPTKDKTIGFYRRWFIIDFNNTFKEKVDLMATIPDWEFENLAKKCIRIASELMVAGKFTHEGNEEMRKARYESKSNILGRFIAERCIFDKDSEVPADVMYEEVLKFCKKVNFTIVPTRAVMGKCIGEYPSIRAVMKQKNGERRKYYVGISIKTLNEFDVEDTSLQYYMEETDMC